MSKRAHDRHGPRETEKKEFEESVLQIDRVTRVVQGGRRLRFRATVAIGDKKGRVGIGIGKATEVSIAVQKAVSAAKKALIRVPITKNDSIPHQIKMKYKAAKLLIFPAAPGTGVIAGGTLRKILELAGIKNVLSKSLGTSNRVVTTQAAIKALSQLRPLRAYDLPQAVKPVSDLKTDPKPVTSKVTPAPIVAKNKPKQAATDSTPLVS